jgi:diguanylate cyclase (GGDEF)-like protein
MIQSAGSDGLSSERWTAARDFEAQLVRHINEVLAVTMEPVAQAKMRQLQTKIAQCIDALDLVSGKFASEAERRRRLEAELAEVQAALAQTRATLAGAQAQERRARYLAMHDSVTSLPNQRFLRETIDFAITASGASPPVMALLYLDLDGFKAINDELGHDGGDELLRTVGARLRRAVRSADVVSRLGGDEFACLLPDLDAHDQLAEVARKLLAVVAAPQTLGKLTVSVRASIGIATCPRSGTSSDALLKSADSAMYLSKRSGSGFAFSDAGAADGERRKASRDGLRVTD